MNTLYIRENVDGYTKRKLNKIGFILTRDFSKADFGGAINFKNLLNEPYLMSAPKGSVVVRRKDIMVNYADGTTRLFH